MLKSTNNFMSDLSYLYYFIKLGSKSTGFNVVYLDICLLQFNLIFDCPLVLYTFMVS